MAPKATYTNPGFTNIAPYSTPLQARISAKFCVAAALLGRPIHEYGYYANTADPEVLALADKIDLAEDIQDKERVQLEVVYDGTAHCMRAAEAETLRPTADKIVAKFRRIAADSLGSRTDSVLDAVLHLESMQNIRELTDQLRPEKS